MNQRKERRWLMGEDGQTDGQKEANTLRCEGRRKVFE